MLNKEIIFNCIDNKIDVLDISNIFIQNDIDFNTFKNILKFNKSIKEIVLNSFDFKTLYRLCPILSINKTFNTINFKYIKDSNIFVLLSLIKIIDIFNDNLNLKL